ncbi:MAG: ferrous iron transport protein B [Deltaproteobacteria bacterium]|nr:ferrous iron transport protein B [Deltaproteobacteria bacterium]
MQLVLVGQPYSGKSTIFNHVVGYKSLSTNAPGSSVEHTHGSAELDGERIDVIDLPGIYSLQASDDAGDPAVEHILEAPDDTVLINVIDASVLARSLELTLQLTELRRPMVVALNMSDEVLRKGITIDAGRLAVRLGVPVVETVGRSGEGVFDLFRAALRAGRDRLVPEVLPGPAHVERLLARLTELLGDRPLPRGLAPRFVAIKLLERDECVGRRLEPHLSADDRAATAARLTEFEATTEQRAEYVMSAVRHNLAFELFESVARVGTPAGGDLGRRLDRVLMHPVSGFAILVAVLTGMFLLVFRVGSAVEPLFLGGFERLELWLAGMLPPESLGYAVVHGVVAGFGGGIGIVVPYLLPFFVALALLEDTGYLTRIAFLMDNLMHRIGLHGMSVVPILMGYGCSVPGVLATRILKSRRDRLITATLTTLIPCSARMTIIFGLIGFFISMQAAVFVYVANLVLIGLVGWVMSKVMPEESPGLIMELPRYRVPRLKALAQKTWFRLKEFVVIAWPILIAGSVVLEVFDHYRWSGPLNDFLAPYTSGLLGFPAAVGVTLLFGIMRKELALVLLFAAIGTADVASVMSTSQIFGYTFFVTFYVPCLATFAALAKELGWRTASSITGVTLAIVTVLTVGLRLVVPLLS